MLKLLGEKIRFSWASGRMLKLLGQKIHFSWASIVGRYRSRRISERRISES